MTNTIRREVERKIADAFLTQALAAGYAINVDNGGDAEELPNPTRDKDLILRTMFATDQDRLNLYMDEETSEETRRHKCGWALFVYANSGWDVISDYTTNLKNVMTKAEELADHYSK